MTLNSLGLVFYIAIFLYLYRSFDIDVTIRRAQSSENTRLAFVPPKPKLFESATLTVFS